jgi:hypothetical protein
MRRTSLQLEFSAEVLQAVETSTIMLLVYAENKFATGVLSRSPSGG